MPIQPSVQISHTCFKNYEKSEYENYINVNYYLSRMWFSKRRNHAYGCLSILLRMRELPNCSEAKRRRLLCILQLWLSKMSTDSRGNGLLQLKIIP